jgi:hypothetical protein
MPWFHKSSRDTSGEAPPGIPLTSDRNERGYQQRSIECVKVELVRGTISSQGKIVVDGTFNSIP